jgi:hypothetical protein
MFSARYFTARFWDARFWAATGAELLVFAATGFPRWERRYYARLEGQYELASVQMYHARTEQKA